MKRSEVRELLFQMSWHASVMHLDTDPVIMGSKPSKEQRKDIAASAMTEREAQVLKIAIEDTLLTALYLLEDGREPMPPKKMLADLVGVTVEDIFNARLKEKGVAVVASEAK